MPGPGPGIHELDAPRRKEIVDGRDKPGHDGEGEALRAHVSAPSRAIFHPNSAMARPRAPTSAAWSLEALPAFARAKTPSRITAMRNSAKARWNGVSGSSRPVRAR